MQVSILILTYNEEANLPACLSAIKWCDDIVIVDSGSSDRTVALANEFGAKVLVREFDNFANQRNWGLDNASFVNDWVLHLDADEVITEAFREGLESLEPEGGIEAYNIPSKTILFGRWIKHAGMYPTYQVRLGHRDSLRFVQVGHGQREDLPEHKVGTFEYPYLHYSFSQGLSKWLDKHRKYAEDEAALILQERRGNRNSDNRNSAVSRRRAAKARAAKLPVTLRPFMRFLYIYFWKQGFRDGRAGFVYAFMLSIYEGMTAILVIEKSSSSNAINKPLDTAN